MLPRAGTYGEHLPGRLLSRKQMAGSGLCGSITGWWSNFCISCELSPHSSPPWRLSCSSSPAVQGPSSAEVSCAGVTESCLKLGRLECISLRSSCQAMGRSAHRPPIGLLAPTPMGDCLDLPYKKLVACPAELSSMGERACYWDF